MLPWSHRLTCCGTVVAALVALGADWAQFRGPHGGSSDERGLPTTWTNQSNIRWKTPLSGFGASSPIVGGDRICLNSYSGYSESDTGPGKRANLDLHVTSCDSNGGRQLAADGKLYDVLLERGAYVLVLKPQFQLLAHNVIADDTSVFNASPVPSRGELLLRSDKFLYCLGGQN